MRLLLLFVVAGLVAAPAAAQSPAPRRTEHVVLIVTDGLRWQEVFRGAEAALLTRVPGGVVDTSGVPRDFWRPTAEARRAALLPFLWGTVATRGVLYGDRDAGSVAQVVNPHKFSYPGYNEIFTGAFDRRITSNDHPDNPNETVFEWIAKQPAFTGRVAAVATWDAFRRILAAPRSGIPVYDGWDPPFARAAERTDRQRTIDELYRTSVKYWPGNAFDAPMHLAAKEILLRDRPRLLFVGYGETDEWAHIGRYDLTLQSARQVDAFIAELWALVQSLPEYRDRTTFIITTDHGRGSGPEDWKHHRFDVDGAEDIWIAVLGPDTPPLGARRGGPRVTQSQVAATVAALLGFDWRAVRPDAGAPLAEVLPSRR
jgi:hypothetical protein